MEKYLKTEFVSFWNELIEDGEIKWNVDEKGKKIENINPTTVQIGCFIWFYARYANEFKSSKEAKIAVKIYEKAREQYMISDTGAFIVSNQNNTYHLYYNSFMLYGMSELCIYNNDENLKNDIDRLVNFIQERFYDDMTNMYREQLKLNLVEDNINSLESIPSGFTYTSNTIIHLLEAYTNLVKSDKKYGPLLKNVLDILMSKFYSDKGFWAPYVTTQSQYAENISYGHDIETLWLVIDAINVLGISIDDYTKDLLSIAKNVEKNAFFDNGFVKGEIANEVTSWWVFAESIVGFYYAKKYLGFENDNYLKIWDYVKENVISENDWYGAIYYNSEKPDCPFASHWKTPYHNGRMLMKMYKYI